MSYFYRHTNGKVIFKPDFVCESGITPHEYFDSDFVEFWRYEVGRHKEPKTQLKSPLTSDAATAYKNSPGGQQTDIKQFFTERPMNYSWG